MSQETSEWLNQNVLVGFTDKRGQAWHYRAADQGAESNHYPGAIPVADVTRRLFSWEAIAVPVYVRVPCPDGVEPDGHDVVKMPDGSEHSFPYVYAARPNRVAVTASDDHSADLGMHGADFQIHSYQEWLVESVATILSAELHVSSAGLLKERAIAWVEVSMEETMSHTESGVTFRPNFLATTGHDGTLASTFKRTFTNTVCDNTRALALSEVSPEFRVKHTKNSNLRIGEARQNLDIIFEMSAAFERELHTLTSIPVTDVQFRQVLDKATALRTRAGQEPSPMAVTKAENVRDGLTAMYRNDMRVAPWSGTAYGVVQLFNTYAHHTRRTNKGTERAERNMLDALNGKMASVDHQSVKWLQELEILTDDAIKATMPIDAGSNPKGKVLAKAGSK